MGLIKSKFIDLLAGAQKGDILYRGDSAWQRLPSGTDGQVLTLLNNIPSWSNLSGKFQSLKILQNDFYCDSISWVDVPNLVENLTANKTYLFTTWLRADAPYQTSGIAWLSIYTMQDKYSFYVSVNGYTTFQRIYFNYNNINYYEYSPAGGTIMMYCHGIVSPTMNFPFKIQTKTNDSNYIATVKKGSFFLIQEL